MDLITKKNSDVNYIDWQIIFQNVSVSEKNVNPSIRASPLAPAFVVSANVSDWIIVKNRIKDVYLTVH